MPTEHENQGRVQPSWNSVEKKFMAPRREDPNFAAQMVVDLEDKVIKEVDLYEEMGRCAEAFVESYGLSREIFEDKEKYDKLKQFLKGLKDENGAGLENHEILVEAGLEEEIVLKMMEESVAGKTHVWREPVVVVEEEEEIEFGDGKLTAEQIGILNGLLRAAMVNVIKPNNPKFEAQTNFKNKNIARLKDEFGVTLEQDKNYSWMLKMIVDEGERNRNPARWNEVRETLVRMGIPEEALPGEIEDEVTARKRRAESGQRMELGERNAIESKIRKLISQAYESGAAIIGFNDFINDEEIKNLIKVLIDGNEKELADKLRNEILAVGYLHDLGHLIEVSTGFNDEMSKKMDSLNPVYRSLYLYGCNNVEDVRNGRENPPVIGYLVKIDEIARDVYFNSNPPKRFDLYGSEVNAVLSRLTGVDKQHFLMARDLYLISGGSARYGFFRDKVPGVTGWKANSYGDSAAIGESNHGGPLRNAIQFKRFLTNIEKFSTGNFPMLWRHAEPCVSSYFESGNITKDDERSGYGRVWDVYPNSPSGEIYRRPFTALSSELLVGYATDNDVVDNINYWFSSVLRKQAEAQGKDLASMGTPTIDGFLSDYAKSFPVSSPKRYVNGTSESDVVKLNKDQYLRQRFGDLVDFMIVNKDFTLMDIKKEIYKARDRRLFDEPGRRADDVMVEFMKQHRIPVGKIQEELASVGAIGESLRGEYGETQKKEVKKQMRNTILEAIWEMGKALGNMK